MPSYKYEFIINGEVDYTCYSQQQANFYAFNMDVEGLNYEIIKTKLY